MTKKEYIGRKFNRLLVLEFVGNDKHNKRLWRCQCDCGNFTVVPSERLTSNQTQSCGCLWAERRTQGITKHGYARVGKKTREYMRWEGIKSRCHNPNNPRFPFYGAKGIEVCEEWRNSFPAFLKEMGKCPDGFEIDRIDNTKGYEPGNCRWVTVKDNKRNMSNNRKVSINGITKCVIEWCELFGLKKDMVYMRIHRGWPESEWFRPPVAATERKPRGGQTKKTETILIEAVDTIEHSVYTKLLAKQTNMHELLELLA